jgi:DNA repair protein RAD50
VSLRSLFVRKPRRADSFFAPRRYERQGTEAQLTQCERDLEKHNSVIVDTKARITALQLRISAADKQLSDSSAVLRNFNDNLRLRSEKKNLAGIKAELDSLDEENARKMYQQFEAQYTEKRQLQTNKQGHVSVESFSSLEPVTDLLF